MERFMVDNLFLTSHDYVIIDLTAPDTQAWMRFTAASSAFLQRPKAARHLFFAFFTSFAVCEESWVQPSFLASVIPAIDCEEYFYVSFFTNGYVAPAITSSCCICCIKFISSAL